MIRISVIVPLYRSASYMRTCVESFLNQTFQEAELILVDDASPDNSYELAKMYEKEKPGKVRALHYDVNRRAGGARNHGLRNATGEYVMFVDADDWLDPTALEKLYSKAVQECCDIVDCDYFESRGETDPAPVYTVSMSDITGEFNDRKKVESIVSGGRCFTKLFRRTMLLEHELYYPEQVRYEDNGICPIMCCFAKRVGKVEEALYYYRVDNPNSQMGTVLGKPAVIDRMKSALYLVEKSKEQGIFEKYYPGVEYRFLELYYASNIQIYVRGDFKMSRQELLEMRRTVESLFPKYKKNPFVKKHFSLRYKLCCICNGVCPELVYIYRFFFKAAYAVFSYGRKRKKSLEIEAR